MGDYSNNRGFFVLTREELIEKRRRKKRRRLLTGVTACTAAAVLLAAGIFRVVKGPRPSVTESGEIFIPGLDTSEPAETDDSGSSSSPAGPVLTGWQSDLDGRYYLDASGTRMTGWFTDTDGSVYLFGQDGYALTGWQEPDIGRVYFDNDGAMITGIYDIDGKTYCFGYDGVNLTGWQDDGNDTYYFDRDTGAAVTGWVTINDEDCWFDENGLYDASKKRATGPAVALTFDDGPGEYTNTLLDILDEYDADATFFMIGEQVNYYADAVRREHDMGMEQGNHSWDHSTLTHLSGDDIAEEISSTNDVIRSVTGDNPTLFRPPGGGYNSSVIENSFGMPMIMWSIDTLDWSTKNADSTYNTVMNNVSDGDIILMHEIYQASVDATRRLIPALQERGFRLVTVSELAREKGVTLRSGYSYGRIE